MRSRQNFLLCRCSHYRVGIYSCRGLHWHDSCFTHSKPKLLIMNYEWYFIMRFKIFPWSWYEIKIEKIIIILKNVLDNDNQEVFLIKIKKKFLCSWKLYKISNYCIKKKKYVMIINTFSFPDIQNFPSRNFLIMTVKMFLITKKFLCTWWKKQFPGVGTKREMMWWLC